MGTYRMGMLVAVSVLAIGLVGPSAAFASTAEGTVASAPSPQLEDIGSFPRVYERSTDGQGAWVWPRGRRLYYLHDGVSDASGLRKISAFDLETKQLVARNDALSPAAYQAENGAPSSGTGQSHTMAVDDEGGRLFVAYNSPVLTNTNGTLTAVARGEVCITQGILKGRNSCFAGVMTLDARTLERTGPLMPLRIAVGTASPAVVPELVALAYSPARGPDEADKVHVLVADHASSTHVGGAETDARLLLGQTPTYVVQFDVASGRQDWVVQLDACRGSRRPRNGDADRITRLRPHPGAVYRSTEAPMVVAACHYGTAQGAALVRIPLDERGFPAALPVRVAGPAEIADSLKPSEAQPQTWVAPASSPIVTVGPDKVWEMIADPASDRVLLKVVDGAAGQFAEVWWVFDARLGQFVGTIGIGASGLDTGNAVLDTERGRLYVFAAPQAARNFAGGLFIADVRRSPLPQALVFPEWAHLAYRYGQNPVVGLVTVPAAERSDPWLLVPEFGAAADYRILVDRVPVTVDPPEIGYEGRTLDLDEQAAITAAAYDGAARGYSVRALLVSGAEAAARLGPADPVGLAYQCNNDSFLVAAGDTGFGQTPCGPKSTAAFGLLPYLPEGCVRSNPEIVLGFVGPDGPNVVDAAGTRGGAQPVRVDSGTAADLETPVSRCSGTDWNSLTTLPVVGGAALSGSQQVVQEPTVESPWSGRSVECVSGGEERQASESEQLGDPVGGSFAAVSDCQDDEASGFAYVRGNRIGDLAVGEALSSFRIYRDPGRGIVSRVESVARGVAIDGVLRIAMVRGIAESWANGRRFTPPGEDQAYDPNCDFERTAGTCFVRHLFGVWTPGYSCGPCGDEQRALSAMSRAMGTNGKVTLREPDPVLARGADNGFIAAITKRQEERFTDLVMNNDLLQTVLPTLEIIRYTSANRIPAGGGSRGRQVYQFAGVEVSSSYGISCLLVYDQQTNTCAAPVEERGTLVVALQDGEGARLAGGTFEVRADVDRDGVVGLADALVPEGVCVTAADGVGTCRFEGLAPGPYLVSQTAAPPGYRAVSDPWAAEMAPGEERTVTFVNASDMSLIEIQLADENGRLLAGAVFAVYPDPDGDGKVAVGVQPVATCTTDAVGACRMHVVSGSYVLAQTAAPAGLEPIEPVPFVLTVGGQTAAVRVVNYAGDAVEDTVSPQPGPRLPDVAYIPPSAVNSPVETAAPLGPSVPDPVAAPGDGAGLGGTIVRIVRAPGDALRLFSRAPVEAASWAAVLALFLLVMVVTSRRRRFQVLVLGAVATAPPRRSLLRPGRGGPTPPTGGGGGRHGQMRAVTQVLDRPRLMGAAPRPAEHATVAVVVASSDGTLGELLTHRIEAAERCRVVGAARSIEELRTFARATPFDVLVVDLALPTGSQDDVCDLLHVLHPAARTVGVIPGVAPPKALMVRGHNAGLGGLLAAEDDLGNGHLAYAVRQVARGKPCYGSTVQATLLECLDERRPTGLPKGLTVREIEVARLAAAGMSRSEVARLLFLSPWTVKLHLKSVRQKVGVSDPRSRHQLRRRLEELGLLEDGDGMTA